jgi:hypothetical protein
LISSNKDKGVCLPLFNPCSIFRLRKVSRLFSSILHSTSGPFNLLNCFNHVDWEGPAASSVKFITLHSLCATAIGLSIWVKFSIRLNDSDCEDHTLSHWWAPTWTSRQPEIAINGQITWTTAHHTLLLFPLIFQIPYWFTRCYSATGWIWGENPMSPALADGHRPWALV